MRHILGHITEYGQFSGELSDLAEVTLETAFRICYRELRAQHGEPQQKQSEPGRVAVCALGKFGGRELGFASDVELMVIFEASGETSGPDVMPSSAFYEKLVQALTNIIKTKHEGIFEVDLRLRPYGRAGRLAVPYTSFRRYFDAEGPAWDYERQSLVKLRPVAGDTDFGQEIVDLRDRLLYDGRPFDVATMRGMRERQVRHLVTPGTINAKHSPGGLVDIEYLVQGLQISYGHRSPELRVANTRDALAALQHAGILTAEVYQSLFDAYNFLRRVINALRMVRGNAKDLTVPPPDSEEFAFLARRLDYGSDFHKLNEDLSYFTSMVQELNQRLFQQLIEHGADS
jgi:glutamate-ammonia-ligase adenylyltransferase